MGPGPRPSSWRSWARTDVGAVRSRNEDALLARPELGLWMVADGAGGHQHGEVASQALTEALEAISGRSGSDLIAEIRGAVGRTHDMLRGRALAEARETGREVLIASTLVVLLAHDSHFACLWAGDSRLYRLRAARLEQLTRDHSLVQTLVDEGAISPEQAEHHPHANVITRAIGAEGDAPVLDKLTDRAMPGDRFLLCSDGLNKALDDRTIGRLLAAEDPADTLIHASLERGVRDNVTAVVVEYRRDPAEDPDATLLRR